MPDAIKKLLAKVSPREHKYLSALVDKIEVDNLAGLDVKKLAGTKDIFRVRKGSFRVIFTLRISGNHIDTIERRSENTYKNVHPK